MAAIHVSLWAGIHCRHSIKTRILLAGKSSSASHVKPSGGWMPYFKVRLLGQGILYSVEGAPAPVIGFYTTRMVRAKTAEKACLVAEDEVLSEWRAGGVYATGNQGEIPTLTAEACWPVGTLTGMFGRRPMGYSFYVIED